ncbi:MAG: glutamate decarboxylase, partial [Candidatus Eremiobacteraeota bacterium]|nr:glutamate decarboxylase [Candidatus Eremiobacteraeota bacterium]
MPLHQKRDPREGLYDDVYASGDLSGRVPKYTFPGKEHDPRGVYQLIHDELILDGGSRLNLATFCTTWAEPEVQQLMAECFDKNMIDKDEYPQTAEIERRCVNIIGRAWHAPGTGDVTGCSTTGRAK